MCAKWVLLYKEFDISFMAVGQSLLVHVEEFSANFWLVYIYIYIYIKILQRRAIVDYFCSVYTQQFLKLEKTVILINVLTAAQVRPS